MNRLHHAKTLRRAGALALCSALGLQGSGVFAWSDVSTPSSGTPTSAASAVSPAPKADDKKDRHTELREDDFRRVTVLRNKSLGENTRLVRLKLESDSESFQYGPGSFIVVRGLSTDVDEFYPFGKNVAKPYLPLHPLDQKGHVDIIVKMYPYPLGDTSRFITQSRQGDVFEISQHAIRRSGIEERLYPATNDVQNSGDKPKKKIGMIVGGSGMTAAVQVARCMLESEKDVEISVLVSDRSPSDVFYDKELSKLSRLHGGRLRIHRTLTRETPRRWGQDTGRVTVDMIKRNMPKPEQGTTIVVCGPDNFVKHIAGEETRPNLVDHPALMMSRRNADSANKVHLQPHRKTKPFSGLLEQAGYPSSSVVVL